MYIYLQYLICLRAHIVLYLFHTYVHYQIERVCIFQVDQIASVLWRSERLKGCRIPRTVEMSLCSKGWYGST